MFHKNRFNKIRNKYNFSKINDNKKIDKKEENMKLDIKIRDIIEIGKEINKLNEIYLKELNEIKDEKVKNEYFLELLKMIENGKLSDLIRSLNS